MVQPAHSQLDNSQPGGPIASPYRTPSTLGSENRQFANTCGLSQNNSSHNFLPAFRNEETGEVALATFADGRQAPMHIILGLPDSWATAAQRPRASCSYCELCGCRLCS